MLKLGTDVKLYREHPGVIIKPAYQEYPEWYKKIGVKSEILRSNYVTMATTKTCPSFISLFKNSYIVKLPSDLHFVLSSEDYTWNANWPDDRLLSVTSHGIDSQIGKSNHIFNNYFSVKININATLESDKDLDLIQLPPIYYNKIPLDVLPGVWNIYSGIPVDLNINTFLSIDQFKKQEKEFIIPTDTVIAMLYSPTGIEDLDVGERKETYRQKFIGDWKYKKKNFKK